MLQSILQDYDSLQFVMKEIITEMGESAVDEVYLYGVVTLSSLSRLIYTLSQQYSKDILLRKTIVENLRDSTQNQMAVYVSTWKYCPVIDQSLEKYVSSILQNMD